MGGTWDFSSAGFNEAIKDFFYSLVKTILVAGAAYVILYLKGIVIDVSDPHFELYTGLITVGRALVSAFLTWVGTLPGTTESAG